MRAEKVYAKVRELTETLTRDELLKDQININASSISDLLRYERSNVSRDLNALADEGRLIKINGRPVSFLDRSGLERILDLKIGSNIKSINHISELFGKQQHNGFEDIIGAAGSLKTAIEQAKASVLYPPKGLNIMITGPTGVGKTTFSEHIFHFAKQSGRIGDNGRLVIFNCSEYASNPQLLLDQLFGHVKGAFTGADTDKTGLVEEANGGILLLDEIHRLSPEGQEMFFLLLDKGIYRRLGETKTEHRAEFITVGATTENPDSALLRTFMRRFHMLITIPSLDERPLEERFQMLTSFFHNESQKIGVPISIGREAFYKLMTYPCKGNIGQLKADVQLICARGLLDFLSYHGENIYIDSFKLPKHIADDSLEPGNWNWQELYRLIGKQDVYRLDPNVSSEFTIDDAREGNAEKESGDAAIEIIVVRSGQENPKEFVQKKIEKNPDCLSFLLMSDTVLENLPVQELREKYRREIVLIEDFTSSMLEEAYARTKNPNILLENLAHQLIQNQINRYIEQQNLLNAVEQVGNESKVILTTCITGEGSAVKIAHLISESIQDISDKGIYIMPINIERYETIDLKRDIADNVIAVVGTVDLGMQDVPYISLDNLVLSDGIERLRKIIGTGLKYDFSEEELGKVMALLKSNTHFLDVKKLVDVSLKAFEELHVEERAGRLKSLRVRFLLHCACMVERIIQNKGLDYVDIAKTLERNDIEARLIKKAMRIIEEEFSISVPDSEVGFLLDLVYGE